MHVATFNRQAVVSKKPERHDFANSPFAEGVLDPGFEDMAAGQLDVMVAGGVMAHFGTLDSPPAGYHGAPLLERVAEYA